MKWALVESGAIKEITEINPKGRFHKSLEWVECLEDTTTGMFFVDGNFIKQGATEDSSIQEENTRSVEG